MICMMIIIICKLLAYAFKWVVNFLLNNVYNRLASHDYDCICQLPVLFCKRKKETHTLYTFIFINIVSICLHNIVCFCFIFWFSHTSPYKWLHKCRPSHKHEDVTNVSTLVIALNAKAITLVIHQFNTDWIPGLWNEKAKHSSCNQESVK